jgi:hypothetical protein
LGKTLFHVLSKVKNAGKIVNRFEYDQDSKNTDVEFLNKEFVAINSETKELFIIKRETNQFFVKESNMKDKKVRILYTNYRGETAYRTIIPENIVFESTEWHPTEQWILNAFDVEKNAKRGFALADIKEWHTIDE